MVGLLSNYYVAARPRSAYQICVLEVLLPLAYMWPYIGEHMRISEDTNHRSGG